MVLKINFKKLLSSVFAIVFFFSIITSYYIGVCSPYVLSSTEQHVKTDAIKIPGYKSSACACVLIDAKSGEILHSENMDARLPMASTTKIMTALLIIRDMPLEKNVKITKASCGVEGSSIYLQEGEELSVKELLYGLLLESGNDAASALAIAHSGDEKTFAKRMNELAAELKLCNTRFENPHGLTAEAHYTSAYDLAEITRVALKDKTFSEICATKSYYIPKRENCRERYFSNHNKLLSRLNICDGVKTGYTIASGRCLVSSASAGDSRFIVVTLDDRNDYKDHKYLLEYAASNYKSVKVLTKGELKYALYQPLSEKRYVFVENKEDVYITCKLNENPSVNMKISITPQEKTGVISGECVLTIDGKTQNKTLEFS